jgi:hypothetical protein
MCLRRPSAIFITAGIVAAKSPRFDRVRHAHAIDLGQDVLRQIRFEIEAHHPAVRRQSRETIEVPRQGAFGAVGGEGAADVAAVERVLFVLLEERNRVQIPAVVRA